MQRAWVRLWFCLAVAFIGFATADPLLEWASNHGLFGPGNFTDHSNADVLPASLCGLVFVLLHLLTRGWYVARTRKQLRYSVTAWARALDSRGVAGLLPFAFALQLGVLYVMETAEQLVVTGHCLGGALWLGGPVLVSLAAHATFCVAITFAATGTIRAFAKTALRIVRFVAAFVALASRVRKPIITRAHSTATRLQALAPVCRIGERAPPVVTI
ncbi:MAG: hypothetical protein ACLPSH_16190 [Vulcanimicrobiaceae bacterium]|jgi:hypothetical protein